MLESAIEKITLYTERDSYFECIDSDDYFPDVQLFRRSKDHNSNNFGVKLLDFCKSTALRIANGRLGCDYNCGNFTYICTYICTSGTSVIDYLLLSEHCFDLAHNFKVHEFTNGLIIHLYPLLYYYLAQYLM